MSVVGAIEVGGTKTVCAIVTPDGELLGRTEFPTDSPKKTFRNAISFLDSESMQFGELYGIGIGNFGPIDIREASDEYGKLGDTPKKGWAHSNVLEEVRQLTRVPVKIDTDVNCALQGETTWGAGKGLSDVIYVTVGTGIGAGILSGGQVLNGRNHPEVGHMLIPRMDDDNEFAGSCPFHKAGCAEGLAAGPAIAARWEANGASLDASHPAWDLEARYLAVVCANLILILAPQRIILGGGVMQQRHLFPMIRERLAEYLGGYVDVSQLSESLEELIVSPALGNDSSVLGASVIGVQSSSQSFGQ